MAFKPIGLFLLVFLCSATSFAGFFSCEPPLVVMNPIVIPSLDSKNLKAQNLSRAQRQTLTALYESGVFKEWASYPAVKPDTAVGVIHPGRGKKIVKLEDMSGAIRFISDGQEYLVTDREFVPRNGDFRTNQKLDEPTILPKKPTVVTTAKKHPIKAAIAAGIFVATGIATVGVLQDSLSYNNYYYSLSPESREVEDEIKKTTAQVNQMRNQDAEYGNKILQDLAHRNWTTLNFEQVLKIGKYFEDVPRYDEREHLKNTLIVDFYFTHAFELDKHESVQVFQAIQSRSDMDVYAYKRSELEGLDRGIKKLKDMNPNATKQDLLTLLMKDEYGQSFNENKLRLIQEHFDVNAMTQESWNPEELRKLEERLRSDAPKLYAKVVAKQTELYPKSAVPK